MIAHVADAFGGAAGYDGHAHVQRQAAEALASRIAALSLPPAPRVLEIGCGTGFLSAALLGRIAGATWLLTDVARPMLDRCAARIGAGRQIRYALLDGERPDLDERFDLICSSFTFQWFADLPAALARLRGLLAPGGHLAFATLLDGSFAEWRAAHLAATGTDAAMADYPHAETLRATGAELSEQSVTETHSDARAFLRALKAIGAHRPRAPRSPLSGPALRRVMAAFDADGARVTYRIGYGIIRA